MPNIAELSLRSPVDHTRVRTQRRKWIRPSVYVLQRRNRKFNVVVVQVVKKGALHVQNVLFFICLLIRLVSFGVLILSSPMQTDATLLANNSQHCWMLHVASVCTPCCMLLDVVAQSLKPVKLFSQQLPAFLLFRDRWSVARQCWIRLHSSSNIVGAGHAHYALFAKTYGLYPSHDARQVPTLLGVVASVCTPLLTGTQQIPTLLAQQCWELLRPFARSLRMCVNG